MLARLRYLLAEGFEISSLGGCDEGAGPGNAVISIVERKTDGKSRIRAEFFKVNRDEMDACSNLFLAHLTKRG